MFDAIIVPPTKRALEDGRKAMLVSIAEIYPYYFDAVLTVIHISRDCKFAITSYFNDWDGSTSAIMTHSCIY